MKDTEDKCRIEIYFNRVFAPHLYRFRHVAMIAVVFSMISSLFLMLLGAYEVCEAIYTFLVGMDADNLKVQLIKGVDVFLIALVLMIFAMGVYDLFVSDPGDTPASHRPKWLKFKDFDQLKSVLLGVIVTMLVITFFELILTHIKTLDTYYEFLSIPVGVLLIAWAFRLLGRD